MYKKIHNNSENPTISSTLNSIAIQYSNLGQYEMALQTFQDVIGKRKNSLSGYHGPKAQINSNPDQYNEKLLQIPQKRLGTLLKYLF